MAELYYKTLTEFFHTGTQAEDAVRTGSVVTYGVNEGYQLHRVEVFPPHDATGDIENLRVCAVVDGEEVALVNIDGRFGAPYHQASQHISIELGDRLSNDPLKNTCLKGVKRLQIKTYGGIGGVTGDYFIRFKGDYFKDDDAVRAMFGPTFGPIPAVWDDPIKARKLTVHKPVPSTIANLADMSGAPKASLPRVMPCVNFAFNKVATTANTPYPLEADKVTKDHMIMKWDFAEDEALIVTHLGCIPHDNSRYLWVEIAGVEYPKDRWDVRYRRNELPIGTYLQGLPIRRLEQPLLVWNELGIVYIQDNGTTIPANGMMVGLLGKKVELPKVPPVVARR